MLNVQYSFVVQFGTNSVALTLDVHAVNLSLAIHMYTAIYTCTSEACCVCAFVSGRCS